MQLGNIFEKCGKQISPMIPQCSIRLRTDVKNKKGEHPLIIQVIYNRKVYKMSVGISLMPDDVAGDRIVGKSSMAYAATVKSRDIMSTIDKKLLELYVQEKLTHETVKDIFSGKPSGGNMSMLNLYESVSKIYTGTISEGRMIGIRAAVRKFDKWTHSMPVRNISLTTITQYQGHLSTKNMLSSIIADIKDLKSIISKANDNGLISIDPFKGYKFPTLPQTKRNYLTPDEVSKIEAFADEPDHNTMLHNVASWFILSCYGGLRYSDQAVWDENKMVKGDMLYFVDEKTSTPQFIPLYPKLERAIERVRGCSPIYKNQVCNRLLKEIAALCKINSHITTHVGRHTFSTNYISNGGSMEVLQQLLGHSKISTTQIYGKITNARIIKETQSVFNNS